MSEPAFPSFKTTETYCSGISQRRLLAGMILSGWLAGMHANDSQEAWNVKGAVAEAIEYADELIKQTNE